MCYLQRQRILVVFQGTSRVSLVQGREFHSPLGQQKLLHKNACVLVCLILEKMFAAKPQPVNPINCIKHDVPQNISGIYNLLLQSKFVMPKAW